METSTDSQARQAWKEVRASIEAKFGEMWRQPELPGMEYRSSKCLADWLEQAGFDVQREPEGITTAFVARRRLGAGGSRIAVLAEFDALPGLDNAADFTRKPTGTAAGHGCGHNHIGPANSGAAIAAANAAAALGLKGEIAVIGCPAEEILWGKVALLQKGLLDGFDAVLTSHGDYQNGALSRPCVSVVSGEFVFNGATGHAGKAASASALDAAELAVQMLDKMRASSFSDVAVRHVLRRAGIMPGITPDETRVWITARSLDFDRTRQVYADIAGIMESAASSAGIRFRHQFISECRGYLPNDTLGHCLFAALQVVGAPDWSEDDLQWMRNLAASCGADDMLLDRKLAFYDQGVDYYGQDDGEISWRIPLGRVNWAYPQGVPIHHWAWTALSGHRASSAGPLMASEALTIAALRLLADPGIAAAARAELERRTGGKRIDSARLGAWKTMTRHPESFWDGSWIE